MVAPVGVEIAGCVAEALEYNQCCCLIGRGTTIPSYPVKQYEENINMEKIFEKFESHS